MTETRRYHLVISGHVQGVWYRESMRQEALKLGIDGWVRNCADGTVEAVICGPASQVETLLAWTRHGPPLARVGDVRCEAYEGKVPPGFERLP